MSTPIYLDRAFLNPTLTQQREAQGRMPAPELARKSYGTKEAARYLCALFSVEWRTAEAMLTIAAELGEYSLNGFRVLADEDAQKFIIET